MSLESLKLLALETQRDIFQMQEIRTMYREREGEKEKGNLQVFSTKSVAIFLYASLTYSSLSTMRSRHYGEGPESCESNGFHHSVVALAGCKLSVSLSFFIYKMIIVL
jgi:hypothetical protein